MLPASATFLTLPAQPLLHQSLPPADWYGSSNCHLVGSRCYCHGLQAQIDVVHFFMEVIWRNDNYIRIHGDVTLCLADHPRFQIHHWCSGCNSRSCMWNRRWVGGSIWLLLSQSSNSNPHLADLPCVRVNTAVINKFAFTINFLSMIDGSRKTSSLLHTWWATDIISCTRATCYYTEPFVFSIIILWQAAVFT